MKRRELCRHLYAVFVLAIALTTANAVSAAEYIRPGITDVVSLGADNQQHADSNLLSNYPMAQPAISGDGRYVAFVSWADGMSSATVKDGFAHVYVRDRVKQATVQADVDSNGLPPVGPPNGLRQVSSQP